MKTILLFVSLILFIIAGCGLATQSLGSVTLHTLPFGLAFLVASMLIDWRPAPRKP